jgi:hypothetical protein
VAKVSNKDAAAVAKETVGKYPPSKPPRAVVKRGTGLSESEKKVVQKKAPVKITKVASKSKTEIARGKAEERNARLKQVLKPLLPRGTAAGGERRSPAAEKAYKDNKSDARVLSADEARAAAQRKARDIEAAKDAKMRDAARIRDEKVAQDRPGPNTKAEGINQAESDARVKKGLEEIKKAERAKLVKGPTRGMRVSGVGRGTFTGSQSGTVGITYTK